MKNLTAKTRQIRIFISSTFRDMHSERDMLVKRVFPEIRQRLEPFGIQLIDIDLRWGITEEQAENEKTIAFCLDSVDTCRPFFIGMLGERYGWIPAPYPEVIKQNFPHLIEDETTSITALEIIHGVLKDQHDNAVFFFRNPDFESDVPEAFSSIVNAESDLHAQKQAKLKEQIRNQSLVYPVVENYPCNFKGLHADWELLSAEAPEEVSAFMNQFAQQGLISKEHISGANERVLSWLQQHATLMLGGLDDFAANMLDAVWAMLVNTFPELANDPQGVDESVLEEKIQQTYVDDLSYLFVGRDTLLKEFRELKGGELAVYCGSSGSGKSALLATLINHWRRNLASVETFFHFAGISASSNLAEALLNRLLHHICEVLEIEIPAGISPDFIPNTIRALLEDFPEDKKLLIAIDALDLVYGKDGFDLRWIPEKLPSSVIILLTVLDDKSWSAQNLDRLMKIGAIQKQIPVFRENERKELIEKMPSLWAKTLDSKQVSLLANHPASNNPLFLTIALEELRKFGSFERLERRIKNFPEQTGEQGLVALYIQLIQRLERELGVNTVKTPLSFLVSSVSGLTESEVAVLCPSIVKEDLAQLWRELRAHLYWSEGKLFFYHQTLQQAILQYYLSDAKEKLHFHQALVQFFNNSTDKERILPELLVHYHILNEKNALAQLVGDLQNYLTLRTKFPGLLQNAWNNAGVIDPVKILHKNVCESFTTYNDILNNENGVPLAYWQPSQGSKEIIMYNPDNDAKIKPLLTEWQQDIIVELARTVEETNLNTTDNFMLALKCLALAEEEFGAVHARTLEALSVALPFILAQLNPRDAHEYATRSFMMALQYLPENHPVSLKIRMHSQDFIGKSKSENNTSKNFNELAEAYSKDVPCPELREFEKDKPIREHQRRNFFAFLLIRHSQMLRTAGEQENAFDYCQQAVQFCEASLGMLHEYSILAKNNLAMFYIENKNDFKTGEQLLKETLAFADSRMGMYSVVGLTLLNNLSTNYGNAGNFKEGLPYYRESVDRKLKIYGKRNKSTLHSMYNLAYCLKNLKQYNEAKALAGDVAATFESMGDAYKSDAALMRYREIEIIEESGEAEKAFELFEPRYQYVIENFDEKDWLLYYFYNTKLASWLEKDGENESVYEIYKDLLTVLLHAKAPQGYIENVFHYLQHMLTEQISSAAKENSQQTELETLQRLIDLFTQINLNEHPEMLHWQVEYGVALNKYENYQEAEKVLREVFAKLEKVKGKDDPETRIAAAKLSETLMKLGKEEEAGAILMESMKAGNDRKTDTKSILTRFMEEKEAELGKEHPETIKALSESADILLSENQVEEALRFLQEAVQRSEKTYGPLADETMFMAKRLSDLYVNQNELSKAEPVLRRIAETFEKTHGLNNENTAHAMESLGKVLMYLEESTEALTFLEKALHGSTQVFGEMSFQTLGILGRVIRLNDYLEKKEQAEKLSPRFVAGISHICSAESVKGLIGNYRKQREIESQERIEREVQVIKQQQQQGRMDYLGTSDEEIRKTAEELSEKQLNVEHPEGAYEIIEWINTFSWLNPDENSLNLWDSFSTHIEGLCHDDEPVKYLPRLRYSEWLQNYKAYELAVEQLSSIWRLGDLKSYFVQQASMHLFQAVAQLYGTEEVIDFSKGLMESFDKELGTEHYAGNLLMNDVAVYLVEKNENQKAADLYEELLKRVEPALGKEHRFVQELVEKLNKLKN